jgi:hypothetical protein
MWLGPPLSQTWMQAVSSMVPPASIARAFARKRFLKPIPVKPKTPTREESRRTYGSTQDAVLFISLSPFFRNLIQIIQSIHRLETVALAVYDCVDANLVAA